MAQVEEEEEKEEACGGTPTLWRSRREEVEEAAGGTHPWHPRLDMPVAVQKKDQACEWHTQYKQWS